MIRKGLWKGGAFDSVSDVSIGKALLRPRRSTPTRGIRIPHYCVGCVNDSRVVLVVSRLHYTKKRQFISTKYFDV